MPSKFSPNKTFESQTALADLGLPFVDVVLTERFLLPPAALKKIGERVPQTLGELATMSGMPLSEVISIIQECRDLDRDVRTPIQSLDTELEQEGTILLDMRPGVEIDTEPLHPAARLFHTQNMQSFLPFLRTLQKVIVISDADDHAWSAAASLKKMGIPAVIGTSKR